ncbi:MAG: hypothetical protein IKT60_04985 [Clostridia bacterium]|nr:hypothetical protein [Clostridia bacterium]
MKLRKFKPSVDIAEYRSPLQVCEIRLYRDGCYFYVCPRCDCSIEREYMHFCDRCGQMLGWDRYQKAKVIRPPVPIR